MNEDDEKRLRNARLLLSIALAAAVVSIPALLGGSAGLFMVGWIASFLGGLGGISDAARVTAGNPVIKYASFMLVFMPVLNVAPIGYHLWRAIQGLSGDPGIDEPPPAPARRPLATPPRPATTPRSAVPPSGSNPDSATRARLLTAIATVKAAGLELGVADGSLLKTSMPGAVGAQAGDMPVVRGSQGAFAVCYLIDQGSGYAYANVGELGASGLTLDALHLVGVKNLARRVKSLKLAPLAGGAFGIALDGQFEASLALVDALWDETLKPHYRTAPVIVVPTRDVLAFCDEGSAAGISELQAVVQRLRASGAAILSDKLLVRRQGAWQAFEPPPSNRDLPPLEFPR